MSQKEKEAYWANIGERIKEILNHHFPISERDTNQILEFLSHNELGVALDHLTATIIEEEIKISTDIKTEIVNLMEVIGYSTEDIQHIKNKAKTT